MNANFLTSAELSSQTKELKDFFYTYDSNKIGYLNKIDIISQAKSPYFELHFWKNAQCANYIDVIQDLCKIGYVATFSDSYIESDRDGNKTTIVLKVYAKLSEKTASSPDRTSDRDGTRTAEKNNNSRDSNATGLRQVSSTLHNRPALRSRLLRSLKDSFNSSSNAALNSSSNTALNSSSNAALNRATRSNENHDEYSFPDESTFNDRPKRRGSIEPSTTTTDSTDRAKNTHESQKDAIHKYLYETRLSYWLLETMEGVGFKFTFYAALTDGDVENIVQELKKGGFTAARYDSNSLVIFFNTNGPTINTNTDSTYEPESGNENSASNQYRDLIDKISYHLKNAGIHTPTAPRYNQSKNAFEIVVHENYVANERQNLVESMSEIGFDVRFDTELGGGYNKFLASPRHGILEERPTDETNGVDNYDHKSALLQFIPQEFYKNAEMIYDDLERIYGDRIGYFEIINKNGEKFYKIHIFSNLINNYNRDDLLEQIENLGFEAGSDASNRGPQDILLVKVNNTHSIGNNLNTDDLQSQAKKIYDSLSAIGIIPSAMPHYNEEKGGFEILVYSVRIDRSRKQFENTLNSLKFDIKELAPLNDTHKRFLATPQKTNTSDNLEQFTSHKDRVLRYIKRDFPNVIFKAEQIFDMLSEIMDEHYIGDMGYFKGNQTFSVQLWKSRRNPNRTLVNASIIDLFTKRGLYAKLNHDNQDNTKNDFFIIG